MGDRCNATATISSDGKGLTLRASGAVNNSYASVLETTFGWGTWPMNTVQTAEGQPLEPWRCNQANACVRYDV